MKSTLLIVEDFNTILDLLTESLSRLSKDKYQILKAKNGQEALKILTESQEKIDLIITDYHMPQMNGIDLLKHIKAHPEWASIPVLFLTSESDGTKMRQAKAEGLEAWVKKPYKINALLDQIEYTLTRKQQA